MLDQDIFIFEFVSGGGFNQVEIPSSLICEGYAMLRTIIEDFKNLGFHITTLLDSRIEFLSHYLKADVIKSVELEEDYLKKYTDCVKDSNYCFVIAPEFSNILFNLTKIVTTNKKTLLSIDLNGVKLGASKLETYRFFIGNKMGTPKSYKIPSKGGFLDLDFILQKFNLLNSPIVIKPDDGVGSELIFYFEKKDNILLFFESSNKIIDTNRTYLLQEYIEGDPMSVSIINDKTLDKPVKNSLKILSINAQNLQITDPNKDSVYFGGSTPVYQFEQLKNQIEDILARVDLSAFQGYFGIDFVKKSDNSLSFIEINPRLTTSYVGIRNILEFNPMALLLNLNERLIKYYKSNPHKFSEFTQIKLKYGGEYTSGEINNLILPKLTNLVPEIITPPIIIEGVNKKKEVSYSCFIATKSNDIQSSQYRISQINQIFNKFDFRIVK
jgi:predicted ATP-grasp superfamily ATP-dependent carboligase